MRLMHFSFTVSYVHGKHLITADALSRAPLMDFPHTEEDLHTTVDKYVCPVLSTFSARDPGKMMKCVKNWYNIVTMDGQTEKQYLIYLTL